MPREEIKSNTPEMKIYLWTKGDQVDLRSFYNLVGGIKTPPPELEPIECHILPDGTKKNRPSLALVLRGKSGAIAFAQLSARSLAPIFRCLRSLEGLQDIVEELKNQKPELE